ncbi:hypothetical protein C8R44DRAFT_751251 [Mycena epipterygia]|nr:hypothetical protein C8R44DRAFT_751251 [Mycena epipterygia]
MVPPECLLTNYTGMQSCEIWTVDEKTNGEYRDSSSGATIRRIELGQLMASSQDNLRRSKISNQREIELAKTLWCRQRVYSRIILACNLARFGPWMRRLTDNLRRSKISNQREIELARTSWCRQRVCKLREHVSQTHELYWHAILRGFYATHDLDLWVNTATSSSGATIRRIELGQWMASSQDNLRRSKISNQREIELARTSWCHQRVYSRIILACNPPSKKTWKRREESSDYEPRPSKEEKARRAGKAVATHYRRHPAARERKKQGVRAARAAKKNDKREWEWDRSREVEVPVPSTSRLEVEGGARHQTNLEISDPGEEVASRVLTSMPDNAETEKAAEMFATPQRGRKQREVGGTTTPCEFSALPPSSPPPASPEVPQRPQVSRSWVSPGEWDDPGSPLPSSAYERMPWPRLFKSLFGPKGDAEPDEEEMERFGFRNE